MTVSLDLNGGGAGFGEVLTYNLGDSATAMCPAASITATGSTIDRLIVTLSSGVVGDEVIDPGTLPHSDFTYTYTGGVLTINNTNTATNDAPTWQSICRAITYYKSTGSAGSKSVTFSARDTVAGGDGTAVSATRTCTITLTGGAPATERRRAFIVL